MMARSRSAKAGWSTCALVVALAAAGPYMPFADAGTTAAERLLALAAERSVASSAEPNTPGMAPWSRRCRVRRDGTVCPDSVEEQPEVAPVEVRADLAAALHDGGQPDLDEDEVGLVQVVSHSPSDASAIDQRFDERSDAVASVCNSLLAQGVVVQLNEQLVALSA